MDLMALMMAPECHTWVSHLPHLTEGTPSNVTQNKTCLFCNSSCCWFICNPLKILSLILAIPLQLKTDLVNVRFAFSFANAALSAFISYLDVLSNFLRSLWTLTLFSECLQSLPTWCHLSVINIPPSSKSWLKILQVSPQKVTLLIYHITALLGSLEGRKCKTFPSFILCSFWKHRH